MSDRWNPSREEVIEGLKKVWDAFDHMEHELYADYVFDALKMLKEQEPRVLTLDEVRYEYEVVWLETKYLQPTVCLVDNGESDADWICFAFGVDDSYPMSWHLCGKSWRCWSSKPTEEQREAVPWQD